MHLGKIFAAQADLISPTIIEIEVDITKRGIPSFTIVGLADKAIDESRERVNAALKNSGFKQPKEFKTVVSLTPADIRKEGTYFDLPIALGTIAADSDNEITFDTSNKLFVGELSLDGSLKPITGVLSIAQAAKQAGIASLFVPAMNAAEATLIDGISVFAVNSLGELIEHLSQESVGTPNSRVLLEPFEQAHIDSLYTTPEVDFAHVVGQPGVKRCLEIAAAGGHNVALYGPPGTGKTMMAKALCGILPPLTRTQQIETTLIHSYMGMLADGLIATPPLRAPHHTSSYVSVIGGGSYPKPGEATLAHNGVLFLDEFPEFDKRVLESLREPLEEHVVRIARSKASLSFPADFMLIAAMNPPSDVYQTSDLISRADERRFKKKISGPIMDRIDMWIHVPKIEPRDLLSSAIEESSAAIQKRVLAARALQSARIANNKTNSRIKPQDLDCCNLSKEAESVLNTAASAMDFSPRVYHKLIKLARTIADLAERKSISEQDMLEAIQYRPQEII